MIIQETPLNTILIIPQSKWALVWVIVWTLFSLTMLVSFILEAESVAWDLRAIQWEDESGEKSGPTGNIISSLFFLGLALLFSIIGIWQILSLERERRIVIDKDRFGNFSLLQPRWLIKDTKHLIPLGNINSVEIVTGDGETADRLYLLYLMSDFDHIERLEVDSGGKKTLVPLAQMLTECLEVELIEK